MLPCVASFPTLYCSVCGCFTNGRNDKPF
uniref:Uncharacterized protein n=1 Tax=Arundo donax TaxID=35708 RepID=A0A0A9FS52_ARUDO